MNNRLLRSLQIERDRYAHRLSENRNKVSNCERAHESLCRFKSEVERSKQDFNSINTNKTSILSEIADTKRNSKVSQKYYNGMQNIFTGIGTRIVGIVYSALLGAISIKLNSYSNCVNDCDADIAYCERKIRQLDARIKEEKLKEAMERTTLG